MGLPIPAVRGRAFRGLTLVSKLKKLVYLLVLATLSSCQVVDVETTPTAHDAETPSGAVLRYDSVHHPVIATDGMVVSQNQLATEVGQQILAQGGNAVDAAVAVGFALSVTLPRAGNLGGSGFMLVYLAETKSTIALDFRSAAPANVIREDFVDDANNIDRDIITFGAKAPGVPGTVAGLHHAWEKFGSLPWSVLLEPARKLAKEGIVVSDDLAFALREAWPAMKQYPSSVAAYTNGTGEIPEAGEILRQVDLAASIAAISRDGADAFYRGVIADKLATFMEEEDGYITRDDLQAYEVRERKPIESVYRDHRVVTMPPSSAGGIALLQMLNVLELFPLGDYPAGSAQSLHLIAETMKRVAANRRFGIGDPDFVSVPIEGFLSKKIAQDMANDISVTVAKPTEKILPLDAVPYESRETTHFSIVDHSGNAVSTTYTLGYSFGSGLVVAGTGILLDNQLRNFYHQIPGHANALEPGKRVISTMTPTLLFNPKGELYIVTGTPGGGRIHNILLQVLINVVDYNMNIAEATHRPRIHQQWRTSALGVEKGINPDTLQLLREKGHTIQRQQTMGSTQSIMRRDGYLYGAADPRRPGALALGVDTEQ